MHCTPMGYLEQVGRQRMKGLLVSSMQNSTYTFYGKEVDARQPFEEAPL